MRTATTICRPVSELMRLQPARSKITQACPVTSQVCATRVDKGRYAAGVDFVLYKTCDRSQRLPALLLFCNISARSSVRQLPNELLAQISRTCISAEVYGPSEDSFALADALLDISGSWVALPKLCVEIGCGSGYVITSAARIVERHGGACHLIATDLSPAALAATRETLLAHKVASTFDLVQADLLGPLQSQLKHKIDLLLFNPPYVPTPDAEISRGGIAASWAGGTRGRVVIDRLLVQIEGLLSTHGDMLMVTVAENDPQGILKELMTHGLKGRICLMRQEDEELLSILHIHR